MKEKIEFTRVKFEQLCIAYLKAKTEGKDSFVFEGHELLVSYAKYLIEYLTTQFR